MAALRGAALDAFLARPDPARPVILVFGPDAGLVAERPRALIECSVDDVHDPFLLVRLDGDDLAADPARLVDEVNTLPLFGGRRAIMIKAGARDFTRSIEMLAGVAPRACRIVIEAGDLKPSASLRLLCERAANMAALPCYADSERD